MQNLKAIKNQRSGLTSLEHFVRAYQEVTVYQMQRVRDTVVNQRNFLYGLLDIFVDVKHAVQQQEIRRLKEDKATSMSYSTLVKNGRTAYVFLSLDSRFAGNSTRSVFSLFQNAYEKNPNVDLIIVGELGLRLFRATFPHVDNYTFYEMRENTQESEVTALTNDLLEYENIDVFTSYFQSLIEQKPVKINITAAIPLEEKQQILERQKRDFLFEPTGRKILNFFEVQIFSSLLRQTVEETKLATLGNRITTLESTYSTLEKQLSILSKNARKQRRKEMNKKQRQRLSGMSLWP